MSILQIIYESLSSGLDTVTCGCCTSLLHYIYDCFHSASSSSDIGMTTYTSFSAGEPNIPTEISTAPSRIERFEVDYDGHLPRGPSSAPAGGTFAITDATRQD